MTRKLVAAYQPLHDVPLRCNARVASPSAPSLKLLGKLPGCAHRLAAVSGRAAEQAAASRACIRAAHSVTRCTRWFTLSLRCRVYLLVVSPGGARDATAGAAERYWRDAHAAGGAAAAPDGDAAEPPAAAFEVAYAQTTEDVHRVLQAALTALRRAWGSYLPGIQTQKQHSVNVCWLASFSVLRLWQPEAAKLAQQAPPQPACRVACAPASSVCQQHTGTPCRRPYP